MSYDAITQIHQRLEMSWANGNGNRNRHETETQTRSGCGLLAVSICILIAAPNCRKRAALIAVWLTKKRFSIVGSFPAFSDFF